MGTKKLVFGVGINNSDYAVDKKETIGYVNGKRKQKLVWACPFYRAWVGMLRRCYSVKFLEKQPTYKDCSVCEEWLLFSNFRSWMEQQDWEGKQLDKDILGDGKLYSPESCVFVSQTVNNFVTDRANARGDFPIGVYWNKNAQKFIAQCCNPFSTKKLEYLGLFACPNEAHQAWLARKLELARILAKEQDDPRVAKALVERYENVQPV